MNIVNFINYEMIRIILVAIALICFDVVTGLLAAFIRGEFKSEIMREGGMHKLMLLLAITFGCFMEYAMSIVDLGVNIPVGRIICVYIIFMEVCSIIENINKGFPNAVPAPILRLFNTKRDEIAKMGEEDKEE